MLISFKVSNFKAILKPICFSMETDPEDNSLKENLTGLGEDFDEKINLLSVIMGPNGSGKSSFIDALKFVRDVALRRDVVSIPRNKLASPKTPSIFEVQFSTAFSKQRNTPQKYVLKIAPDGSACETIFQLAKSKWEKLDQIVFFKREDINKAEKNFLNIDWVKEHERFDEFSVFTNKFSLSVNFFQNLVFFNSIENETESNFNLYMSSETISKINELDPNLRCLTRIDLNKTQNDFKKILISLLNAFGVNVKNLGFKVLATDRICTYIPTLQAYVSPSLYASLKEKEKYRPVETKENSKDFMTVNIFYLKELKYKGYSVPVVEESSGTKRLVKLAFTLAQWLHPLFESVLVIDELDAGLHETLPSEIIKQFIQINRGSSQLIAITHSTALLRDGLLRKDEIWFSEMKEDRTTSLYSLADLKNVKSSEDFAENYLCGKYGALPLKKEWLFKEETDNE